MKTIREFNAAINRPYTRIYVYHSSIHFPEPFILSVTRREIKKAVKDTGAKFLNFEVEKEFTTIIL